MNPDVKRLWIEELLSGRHKQATNRLHYSDGRKCCLGVLCYLASEAGVVKSVHIRRESRQLEEYLEPVVAYEGSVSILPSSVIEWAGLQSDNNTVCLPEPYKGQITLANVNDAGASFEEIATLIEKYF